MGIKLEGNSAFIKAIQKFDKESTEFLKDEIQITLDQTYNRALVAAPADLGGGAGLRGSAYKDVAGLKGEVGFRQKYAAYVEFGTGSKVDIPEGLKKYAMDFYVSGKGRLPAKPYLFPAFFDETRKFVERLKQRFK